MKFAEIVFLVEDDVVFIHNEAIRLYGGASGWLNRNDLLAALGTPTHGYHQSLEEIAASYAHGICNANAFLDGNKRTAIASARAFLEAHGVSLRLDPTRWEPIMLDVAMGLVTRDKLRDLFIAEQGGASHAVDP